MNNKINHQHLNVKCVANIIIFIEMDYIFQCFLCPKEFKNEKVIVSHLKIDHFLRENSSEIKCVIKGKCCSDVFFTYSSLKLHLKKCMKSSIKDDVGCVYKEPENNVHGCSNVHCSEVLSSRCSEDNDFSLQNITGLQIPPDEDSNIFQFRNAETENSNQFCEETMNNFLELFNNKICNLMLNHKQITIISNLCIDLVQNVQFLNQYLINKPNGLDVGSSLSTCTAFVNNKLKECSTKYMRTKHFESNELYVAPNELTIGLRYTMSRNDTEVAVPRIIPCKFHYVPITATVFSLFQRADFRKEYFEFNKMNGQSEVDGVYSQYSSGSRFKSSTLFSKFSNSLQIEIATDDIDVCNAIGSKATMHKLCPVYIAIKNIPPQFSSRLDAISLASLSYSNDMVTKYTDFNDIWRPIVHDISQIEDGIDIGGEIIRG